MILSLLIVFGLLALSFKITGWIFRICGKLFGFLFSIIGYLILGGLAVGILGVAFFVIPIIFVVGIVAICKAIIV